MSETPISIQRWKSLNPFVRIFGDCSKWNERPIRDVGEDVVYYGTKLSGPSNAKAKAILGAEATPP